MDLMKKFSMRLFALLVVGGLLAAGCGGDGSFDTATEAASDAAFEPNDAGGADAVEAAMEDEPTSAVAVGQNAGGDTASLGGGAAPTQVDPAALGRDIIYTADLLVAVDDVTAAGLKANQIISELGGLLFGQQTISDGEAISTFTFRVRPQDFQAALSGLGSIGELRNQNVSTEDVTGKVVDLESRIATSAASVERLRTLLGDAATVEVVAQLEQQLLERETNLEVLRGQLRSVKDRVDLATITLTLTEALARPAVGFSTTAYIGHDRGVACPGSYGNVDKGDDVTICFEIVNQGDSPLGEIEITDTVLEITTSDLIVIYGDPTTELLPGQSLIYAYETDVDRTLRLRTRVNASPVTVDGEAIDARSVQSNQDFTLNVFEPDALPTFGDALSGGWTALKTIGQVILLIIGALIPFFWVPIVLWLLWRWRKGRPAKPSESSPPPPRPSFSERAAPKSNPAADSGAPEAADE